MSGKLFISCPICDRENTVSAARDKRIIVCRNCGAPIYDTTRPAKENDISIYQAILKQWGEKYRKSDPERLKRQIESTVKHDQRQAETAALNKQIRQLKADLYDFQKKYQYLENRYQIEIGAVQQKHAIEIKQQQVDLRREVGHWKSKYQKSLASAVKEDSSIISLADVAENERRAEKSLYFNESELVSLYDRDCSRFGQFSIVVEPTQSSLKRYIQGQSDSIQLEARDTGKYWAIPSNQPSPEKSTYYLALRKDVRFNQQNFSMIGACFNLQGRSPDRRDFELVSLAAMKPIDGKPIWELVRRGKVRFKSVREAVH